MPVAAPDLRPRFPQAPFPISNGTVAATSRSTSQTTTLSTSRQIPAATRSGQTSQGSGTPQASTSGSGGPQASGSGGYQASGSQGPQASRVPQASGPQAASTSAQTPTSIPKVSYAPITIAPSGAILPATTSAPPVPSFTGGGPILRGTCSEPAYTILDGPTALWIPVIGCVSSKSDCCPQPTKIAQDAPEASQSPGAKPGAIVQFPIGALPDQKELKACPNDYHTVSSNGGIACCPQSYWLWSTQIGGQTPCYSSLSVPLAPPPIPESLASTFGALTRPGQSTTTTTKPPPMLISGSITPAPLPAASDFDPPKPTSAIVNIAYAMQYRLAAEEQSAKTLANETKIGIGVGAAAGSVLILGIVAFLIRRFACGGRKRTKNGGFETLGSKKDGVSEMRQSDRGFEEVQTEYVRPGGVRIEDGIEPVGEARVPLMTVTDGSASTRPVAYRD